MSRRTFLSLAAGCGMAITAGVTAVSAVATSGSSAPAVATSGSSAAATAASGSSAAATAASGSSEVASADAVSAPALSMVVLADTHLQADVDDSSGLSIPQMTWNLQIYEAWVEKTREIHPDIVLYLGDLACSGHPVNHDAVIAGLDVLAADGIRCFVIPGNHDLSEATTREVFEERYAPYGYADALSRDEGTASYIVRLSDNCVIAMLDTVLFDGSSCEVAGGFPAASATWLSEALDRYVQGTDIVLCATHHPILYQLDPRYELTMSVDDADDLIAVLKAHDIHLNLAGHIHMHEIIEGDDLTEITNGMPMMYPHEYETLDIVESSAASAIASMADCRIDVAAWAQATGQTEPDLLDFDAWSQEVTEQKTRETMEAVLDDALAGTGCTAAQEDEMIDFWIDFTTDSWSGPIDIAAYESTEGYALWMKYAADTRYGIWLPHALEHAAEDISTCKVRLS